MSVGLLGCCPAAVWKVQKPAKAPGRWERCFEHLPVRPTLDLQGEGSREMGRGIVFREQPPFLSVLLGGRNADGTLRCIYFYTWSLSPGP